MKRALSCKQNLTFLFGIGIFICAAFTNTASALTITAEASSTSIEVGESIQFNTNVLEGEAPYIYEWDFDDINSYFLPVVKTWEPGKHLLLGDKIIPSTPNGYIYEVFSGPGWDGDEQIPGITGETEPVWPTTIDITVIDNADSRNELTFRCIGLNEDTKTANPAHTFNWPGKHYVKVKITDNTGEIKKVVLPVDVRVSKSEPVFNAVTDIGLDNRDIDNDLKEDCTEKFNNFISYRDENGDIHSNLDADGNIRIEFPPGKYLFKDMTCYDYTNPTTGVRKFERCAINLSGSDYYPWRGSGINGISLVGIGDGPARLVYSDTTNANDNPELNDPLITQSHAFFIATHFGTVSDHYTKILISNLVLEMENACDSYPLPPTFIRNVDNYSHKFYITVEDCTIRKFGFLGNYHRVIHKRNTITESGDLHDSIGVGRTNLFRYRMGGLSVRNYIAHLDPGHSNIWYFNSPVNTYIIDNYADMTNSVGSPLIQLKYAVHDTKVSGNILRDDRVLRDTTPVTNQMTFFGKVTTQAYDSEFSNNRVIGAELGLRVNSSSGNMNVSDNFFCDIKYGVFGVGHGRLPADGGVPVIGVSFLDNTMGANMGYRRRPDDGWNIIGNSFEYYGIDLEWEVNGVNSADQALANSRTVDYKELYDDPNTPEIDETPRYLLSDPSGWYDETGYLDPGPYEYVPPTVNSFVINNGAARTNSQTVTLSMNVTDSGSGMGSEERFPYQEGALMQFSNDGMTWAQVELYSDTHSWQLSDGDGQKTVYAKFRDRDGNWTRPVLAHIIMIAGPAKYVSTLGSEFGDGTEINPWDLQTALSHPAGVRPGDTIWLRGGTYYYPDRSYRSTGYLFNLQGTPGAPITVRAYPGERATIDGGLQTTGTPRHVRIQDLEITVSENMTQSRTSSQTGSNPTDMARPRGGIILHRDRDIKIINNVVQNNTHNGIGFWARMEGDSELYGNLISDNGWIAQDRAHGHGIYAQNEPDNWRYIRDNILFNTYSCAVHVYGSHGNLDQFVFQRNFFSAGSISGNHHPVLVGGGGIADHIIVSDNVSYEARFMIGYSAGADDVVISGNTIIDTAINGSCTNLTKSDNFIWDGTTARIDGVEVPVPANPSVFLNSNAYDFYRANLAIVTFHQETSALVDFSGFLAVGDTFELKDPSDFYGAPVHTGTYNGNMVPIQIAGEFTYYVVLRNGLSGGAHLNLSENNMPEANDDTYTFGQSSINVLANDTDEDNDELSVTLVEGPSNHQGEFILTSDGSFNYLPNPQLTDYVDKFTYRVSDGKMYSAMATVTIIMGTIPDYDITFNSDDILSYGGSQDAEVVMLEVLDNNKTLYIKGNSWKAISLNRGITPYTFLEFDYKSSVEGEIQAIGFDIDLGAINLKTVLKVHGTDARWETVHYDDYADTAPDTKHYIIPMGEYYTGQFNYLVFANDHDGPRNQDSPTAPTAESYFSNIRIYEENQNGPTYTITATAHEGGSISPNGEVSIREYRRQTFSVIPNTGYAIDYVSVDDSSIGRQTSYTFTDVRSNHSIDAYFVEVDTRSPVITLTNAPENDSTVDVLSIRIEGTVTDNDVLSSVTLNGNTLDLNSDGEFNEDVSLTPDSLNVISIRAEDISGNVSTTTLNIYHQRSFTLTADQTSGVAPLEVTFTAVLSDDSDIILYEWDFDGKGQFDERSNDSNEAEYTFTGEGTYPVTLRALTESGASLTRSVSIFVQADPAASPVITAIEADVTEGTAPLIVSFTQTSFDPDGEIQTYEWDFDGDGIYDVSSDVSGDIVKRYTLAGTYMSYLKITDDDGLTHTRGMLIEVLEHSLTPTVTLDASYVNNIVPVTVNFTATAQGGIILRYEWDFDGNGVYDIITLFPNVSYTYENVGTLTVSVKVVNDKHLEATASVDVRILGSPPSNTYPNLSRESGPIPLTVDFGSKLSGITGVSLYLFDFDGDLRVDLRCTPQTLNTAVCIYKAVGVYKARILLVGDDGWRKILTVYVHARKPATPGVYIKLPKDNWTVSGSRVMLLAKVAPKLRNNVDSVQFQYRLEGQSTWININDALTKFPCVMTKWDTTSITDGSYEIQCTVTTNNSSLSLVPLVSSLVDVSIDNSASSDPDFSGTTDADGDYVITQKLVVEETNEVSLDDGTNVTLPYSDMIPEEDKLTVETVGDSEVPALPVGSEITLVGIYRKIRLSQGHATFTHDVEITIPYGDEDIDLSNEKRLKIFYYNEGNGTWEAIFDSMVIIDEKVVKAKTHHFSLFGLGFGGDLFDTGGGDDGGDCFIATASYGTPMANEVITLRAFRDEHLLKNHYGQKFVETYYRLSPPVADYIRERPTPKTLVRNMLQPLVWLARKLVR